VFHLIICGDINYPIESKEKQELNNILNLYNLASVINIPTRVKNNLTSAIDIFVDTTQFGMHTMGSTVNGLSDHNAQMLELHVVNLNSNRKNYKTKNLRNTNFNPINVFQDKLSSELGKNVFDNDNKDVYSIFNCFLNTYLHIFYSFPLPPPPPPQRQKTQKTKKTKRKKKKSI
jgi:hypothetical protein